MRLLDLLYMARDNLRRSPLRTTLTAIGVAIGIAAVVTLISLGNGSEAILVGQARGYTQLTSVVVYPSTPNGRNNPGRFHALTQSAFTAISRLPHVTAVDRFIVLPPLRLSVGRRSADLGGVAQGPLTAGVTLVGRAGNSGTDGVLVPASLAHTLGLTASQLVGRRATVTIGGSVCCSNARTNPVVVLGPDRHFTARVAGVYSDKSWQFTALLAGDRAAPLLVSPALGGAIMGSLSGMSGATYLSRRGYDALFVSSGDARQTATVADKIGAMSYQVRDYASYLTEVHTVFSILTAGLGAVGGIALLVAAVGIANTLIMTILERTREIGIMKALGAEPRMVRRMFLCETALVGAIGGLGGLVLAALGTMFGNVAFHIWLKRQGVNASVGNLFAISAELAAGALVLAVAVSLVAGAWPSQRAVRLQPLDALRHE